MDSAHGKKSASKKTVKVSKVVLASTSKFRRSILERTKLAFTAEGSEVDETVIKGDSPKHTALLRARAKALDVARRFPGALVIGADQTLSFEGRSFDKASNSHEAKKRLNELSGATHFLHSAVSIAIWAADHSDSEAELGELSSFCVDVRMDMRDLSEEEIATYVETGEWAGCVGCYQVENIGGLLFESIGGDDTSVIGLPLSDLNRALKKLGVNILSNSEGPWSLEARTNI